MYYILLFIGIGFFMGMVVGIFAGDWWIRQINELFGTDVRKIIRFRRR